MNYFARYFDIFLLIFKIIKLKLRYPGVRILNVKKKIGTVFSQDGQDLYVLPILYKAINREKDNWLVDVGANHPVKFSNTILFEKYFSCKTIAIEPLKEFKQIWSTERPDAELLSLAVGADKGETHIAIPIHGDTMFSSVTGGVNKKIHTGEYESRRIKVDTLKNILEQRGIREVLLLSIDVEGFELDVLKGIDFNAVSFKIILCENNSDGFLGANLVRDYIISKGYIYYARVGWNDDLFLKII